MIGSGFTPSQIFSVYEYITRHFLACCSKDAVLAETELQVAIGYEWFNARGIIIKEKNYLDIYKYERQSENSLPPFHVGEQVRIIDSHVEESMTTVPLEDDLDFIGSRTVIGT